MSSDFLKCEECRYENNCPVFYSYLNAACITIQKPKELPFFIQCHHCGADWWSDKWPLGQCPSCGKSPYD